MTRLELEIHDDVVSALTKIKSINDEGIDLIIPEGSILFDSIINLKLLKKESDKALKVIHFETKDEIGITLLEMLEGEETTDTLTNFEEVVSPDQDQEQRSENVGEFQDSEVNQQHTVKSKFKKLSFSMPSNMFNKSKNKLIWIVGLVLVGAIGFGIFTYISKLPRASIDLIVNSETLTKSIQIKVRNGVSTSASDKIVRGLVVSTNTTVTTSAPTTGQKFIGNKATGTIKIFNKTTEPKTFKKGQVVIYSGKSKDLNFTLDEEVTIPSRTETPPADPLSGSPTVTWGENTVDVHSDNIGPDYNISSSQDLEVKGQKSSDFTAVNTESFTGGTSKSVKIVLQADKTKLSADTAKTITEQAQTDLLAKVANGQKYIQGSVKSTISSETFNKNVNDETDTLQLTQTITAEGLIYYQTDMDRLLDQLVKDFIPKGFALSDKERETSVQVLGSTATTVLNNNEADLQVTLKAFIIPDITEDKIKQDIMGMTPQQANDYLNNINNVKSFALSITPTVPFFTNIPKDLDRIDVSIERQ